MNAVAAGEIRTSAARLLPAEFLHAMLLIVAHGSCEGERVAHSHVGERDDNHALGVQSRDGLEWA
jgi:hypothetical protein